MTNKRTPGKRTPKEERSKEPKPDQPKPTRQTSRQLTTKSKLDNFKKEAKRWLKALRANDEQARTRLTRAYPDAPDDPGLREVQHALAREHGLDGWMTLRKQLEALSLETHPEDRDTHKLEELVDLFLEYACADPILCNGPAAHGRRGRAALRILTRYPEIACYNIHTAVVCGDMEEVERILKKRPAAAIEPGGPQRRRQLPARDRLWSPLLHLCYGRLPTAAASDNAVAIARLLLDCGADANDYFECGSHPCRYTALCGVAGEGEDDGPPHPQKQALAQLLLERGAEPYDIQLFYNTHFHGDILWILELIYDAAVKAGRQADWDDPEWSMIDMGGYNFGARYLLGNAVSGNDLRLAEWLLEHGASPNASAKPDSKFPRRSRQYREHSLHAEAQRQGFTEMAELLMRYGATSSEPFALEGIATFTAVCFRLDRQEAQKQIDKHPEYLLSHEPIFAAARRDRADVVEFLLDLGTSIEVEDQSKQHPLHEAAGHDALRVAELLIERGAQIDPVETNWNNQPIDHALYGNLQRMVWFLSRFIRDVYRLTWIGNVERLREVLNEKPDLARVVDKDGSTPLMWICEDELLAKEIIELLIAHGADPTIKNKEGMTAADYAEKRGLYEIADLLRSKAASALKA